MPRKLVAVNDRVLLKPVEKVNESNGPIVIADMGEDRPEIGVIVSIGPGAYSVTGTWIPTSYKEGTLVAVPKVACQRFPFEGEEYYITSEREISVIIQESDSLDDFDINVEGCV